VLEGRAAENRHRHRQVSAEKVPAHSADRAEGYRPGLRRDALYGHIECPFGHGRERNLSPVFSPAHRLLFSFETSPNAYSPAAAASKGAHDPYYSTALGRAIAAHLPESEPLALIARTDIEPRTPFRVRDRAGLAARIEETGTRGLAVDEQENDVGVICLGIAFPDRSEVAALSVSVPASRMTAVLRRRLEEALLRSVPQACGRIGARGRPAGRAVAR
jgi:hypothetical protein